MRRFAALGLLIVAFLGVLGSTAPAATENEKVLCWNKNWPSEGPPQIRATPRKCSFFVDGIDFNAGAAHFRRLRWKNWGSKAARAKGEYLEPMAPTGPWHEAKLKLRKPVERCGRTVYSKLTFRVPEFNGKYNLKLWTC